MVKTLLTPEHGQRKSNHDLSSEVENSFNFLKQFFLKYRNNGFRKLLESFKKEKRKSLEHQAQHLEHNSFQKVWFDFVTDTV